MARLRCFDSNLDGFSVAHLSNQNHLRSLTEGCPQSEGEARGIAVQFTLMNNAILVGMQELYGIFDSEHVVRLIFVYFVDDGCKRGRLARARGTRDQYDSVAQFYYLRQFGGQTEPCKIRDFARHNPHHNG